MLTPSAGFWTVLLIEFGIIRPFESRVVVAKIDYMGELLTLATEVAEFARPVDHYLITFATEMGGQLLGQLERHVHRMGQAHQVLIIGFCSPPS